MSSADEEMQDASTVQTPAATLEAENEDEEAAGKIRMVRRCIIIFEIWDLRLMHGG